MDIFCANLLLWVIFWSYIFFAEIESESNIVNLNLLQYCAFRFDLIFRQPDSENWMEHVGHVGHGTCRRSPAKVVFLLVNSVFFWHLFVAINPKISPNTMLRTHYKTGLFSPFSFQVYQHKEPIVICGHFQTTKASKVRNLFSLTLKLIWEPELKTQN